jgi:hypothetical protein
MCICVISQRNQDFGADSRKKKLRWFSFEFLRVRRKISSTPFYAYLHICVFSKEITAFAHRPLAPLTHTEWKRDSGPTQRRCLLLLPPPVSSIDIIASPLPSPPPSPCCHRRAASSIIAAIATALTVPPSPRYHHCRR